MNERKLKMSSKINLADRQLTILAAVKRGFKIKTQKGYRRTENTIPFTADRLTRYIDFHTRGVVYSDLMFLLRIEFVKRSQIERVDAQYPTGPLPFIWQLTDKGKAYLERTSR